MDIYLPIAGMSINFFLILGCGGAVGFLSGTRIWRSVLRMVGLAAVAAGVTYAVGKLFGAAVT
jgi:VIT1/CCC1 family predicted Fe2+/Mn2+ transporter